MIIIHAADIHLGSPLRGLDQHEGLPVEQLRAAPLHAFERIADLCRDRSADLLLVAGDLFDGDADMSVIAAASRVLKRIVDGGTRVVTLRGNHDAASKMQRRVAQIEGVHELSTAAPESLPFDDLGVVVHGRGFDTPRVDTNIAKAYPSRVDGMFNVGMLHTSLEGNVAHPTYAPCSVGDLTGLGYEYWALGHIHQHAIVARDPWIVYAGSPQARHIGEVGEHGAYVLEVVDGVLAHEPEHVELGTVQWHRVALDVSDEQLDAETVCALVRQQLEAIAQGAGSGVRHVVRVTITGRCAAHAQFAAEPARWREHLHIEAAGVGGEGTYLEKVRLRTLPVLPPPEELRGRTDVVGDLARRLAAEELVLSDAEAPDDAVPSFAAIERLDEKLSALGARSDLRNVAVTSDELVHAGDQLLAHLMLASVEAGVEEAR